MAKLIELQQIAFQAETTEGTAPDALAAGDAKVLVHDITYKADIGFARRNTRYSDFDKHVGYAGARMATIGFKFEMIGNTAAGTAPSWALLMNAAGVISTVVSNTVELTPASRWNPLDLATSNDFKSLHIGAYCNGRYREIVGARPSKFVISAKAGGPWIADVEFIGAAATDPSDTAMLSSVTFDTGTNTPPIFVSAAFSLGGLSSSEALLDNFTLDLGLTTTMRSDANSATGYRSAAVVNRRPTLAFLAEMVTTTEHDFYSIWKAGTTAALSCTSGSSNNKLTLTAPAVQYTDMTEVDQGGLLMAQMQCDLCRSSGNDSFKLTLGT